ncbi:hypothetical protein ABZ957_33785 [Streptomyces sp. NPDC046316]|uniref:hypothetical protein n=1 Tax=Streptomyces sp. NPDC046316 TaxID=3154494 RepID=UPI003401E08A
MTKAREIMTAGAQCIGAQEIVLESRERDSPPVRGALPIWGTEYGVTGMLTDRSILVKVPVTGRDPAECTAGEFAKG